MSNSYQNFIHPKVQNLHPYVPGKSIQEIQDKYFVQNVIKLASNENPLGCSPQVIQTIQHINSSQISLYPATYHHPLPRVLSDFLEIDENNLFLAPGSDAIFNLLIQAYVLPLQKNILTHQFAFMGYEIQAATFGLNTIKAPIDVNSWKLYPEEIIALARDNVSIIFIANPNNPTGQILEWDALITILNHIPKSCLLVIDEAYYEFSQLTTPPLKELLKTYSNLIITRTFSKAYGLASLRLGYGIAHSDIVETLKKIQLPFTINQIALDAGVTALQDQQFILQTQVLTEQGKRYLTDELSKLPFKVHNTRANFITIEYKEDVIYLITFLESQGVIVRGLHSFGLPKAIRITIGTEEQNKKLITLLNTYFSKD